MRSWMLVRLALDGLRRTPLRVLLTVLGVTIASGSLVSMVAFALGLQRHMEVSFEKLGLLNTVEVSEKKTDDASDAGLPLDAAAVDAMAALPGVDVAYPDLRTGGVRVLHGEAAQSALAIGVPREPSLLEFVPDLLVAGRAFSPGDEPEVLLGRPLVEELGFASSEEAIGASVTIEVSGLSPDVGPTFTFERRAFPVTVVGVYEVPRMAPRFARGGILLPTDLMREVPGVHFATALESLRAGRAPAAGGFARVVVRVRRPVDILRVERDIAAMGFETRSALSRLERMQGTFIFLDVLLAAVGTIALVVAGLGIINTLLMSVLERYQEIGIAKAIGASEGDVRLIFLTEAAIVGFAGGLAGLALGRVVAAGLDVAVNAYARSQGVTFPIDVFAFPAWLLVATVCFAVGISVLAGAYPASRAARVDPIRALRGE